MALYLERQLGSDHPAWRFPQTKRQTNRAGQRTQIRLIFRVGGFAGVIAFSRTGDIDLGDYDDAIMIAKYGDLPDDQEPD